MAYTDIDDPTLYFSSTIWTGNGVDDRNIVIDGTGMQPDFVWIKSRNDTDNHRLVDSVRGATKHLESDGTGAEQTSSNVKAFTSTGVTLSTNGSVNANSELYASWSWKAGTSFTNDASATGIGTIDSTGSVNTDAGFSIISYTGNATTNATVAHGLGVAPSMMIVKKLNGAFNWGIYHKTLTAHKLITFTTNTPDDDASYWNDVEPTSTVFNLGSGALTNGSGSTMIAYCFAEKQGFSKFSSYTGNGNADGTFIYTGFKPAFIMIKRTDVAKNWYINDNLRLGYNVNNPYISPNITAAETGGTEIDILSNGFKIRASGTGHNQSGGTYIYMAIAENPFVTSTGVPATAR